MAEMVHSRLNGRWGIFWLIYIRFKSQLSTVRKKSKIITIDIVSTEKNLRPPCSMLFRKTQRDSLVLSHMVWTCSLHKPLSIMQSLMSNVPFFMFPFHVLTWSGDHQMKLYPGNPASAFSIFLQYLLLYNRICYNNIGYFKPN